MFLADEAIMETSHLELHDVSIKVLMVDRSPLLIFGLKCDIIRLVGSSGKKNHSIIPTGPTSLKVIYLNRYPLSSR